MGRILSWAALALVYFGVKWLTAGWLWRSGASSFSGLIGGMVVGLATVLVLNWALTVARAVAAASEARWVRPRTG